ncbi:esterase-like activity of phytase family protein [Tateyamaria omphalii]|uniref:esterase-like activity of phytase family protein n=1 Tax=Tateyamaria omphalii TaxID=299262 RepID=UPI001C98F349|nr:esterase-like activity of phytase family protein [Tateyamaria omphalii]MBY5933655.1 esterase-like activity of phytase family protein [Tateyamaria omphalii]
MLWRSGLALILTAAAATADPLTFVRSWTMVSDRADFGGLSAIEMEDGNAAIVLSDRGALFTLALDRDALTVDIGSATQPRPDRDSEGLARSGDTLYFSYEGPAEIVAHDGTRIPPHPDFSTYHPNGSLEALAADEDGTLYTLPERSGAKDRPFPIYRYRNGAWDILTTLPRTGPFLPAGADIGPDGLLYILERAFTPLGFRSRIRRMDPNAPDVPAETLLTASVGQHDNLEGLAIWQSESGATCLTMVSDDNFLPVQRSELVEYALTETLAGGATCD